MRSILSHVILSLLLVLFGQGAWAQTVHGILRVVKGDVRVISASDGKEIKAKIGQKVYPKDTIIAGVDSRAKIVMVDNNEINISPDSKVVIQSYEYNPEADTKKVNLNVLYGKIRAKVNQKYEGENRFQVKTPSAVAGVRGTDFMTSYSNDTKVTQIVTFEGSVVFGVPGPNGQINNPVTVAVGQTSASQGSSPPAPPSAMPKNELSSIDSESKSEGPANGPNEGGDNRQPASEGQKSSEPNKEGGGGQAGGDPNRGPNSMGPPGGSMMVDGDIPSGNFEPPPMMDTGSGGILPEGPRPDIYRCDFCQDVIQNGRRGLNINVLIEN